MGLLHCINTLLRPVHLLLLVLILLSSTQIKHRVEGRSLFRLLKLADVGGGGEKKETVRALIGSRPPICERRCINCGHCEAVQVPVIPQDKGRTRKSLDVATLRGDYSSNYKPLSWKCKCGDIIFNP